MSFGSEQRHVFSLVFGDPGADNKQIHLFRAPANQPVEILSAYLTVQNAQGSGSAGAFELQDWGTAGTAVEGTIAAAVGGTAASARISAATPEAYTISEGTIDGGDWVVLDYQETGDFVEQNVTVIVEYVLGFGANA